MQQSTRRLAWFMAGTFSMSAGLVAVACSTDNGGGTTPIPTVDSGKDGHSSSSSSSGSSGDTDGSSSGGLDAGPDCSGAPKVKSSDGPYCFAVADAGEGGAPKGMDCPSADKEICCSGQRLAGDAGFENSTCETATVASSSGGGYDPSSVCQNGFTVEPKQYHCTEAKHCPGTGEICCAIGADAGVTLQPGSDKDFPGCNVYFQSAKYVGGTRCQKDCAAGEIQLCSSDSECKNGKCLPITIDGRYTGFCKL